ncbi:hypothetical protein KW797_02935 [Candidatus Parcubacteria bacterium]|nr:hypothetical protein [Candidatus Parcubacteria bacterium]
MVEPTKLEEPHNYILPDSAQMLFPATVIDPGPDYCLVQYMEKGISELVQKSVIAPDVKPGAIVLYRKIAEERHTMDGAYRRILADGRTVILVKILDIVATVKTV